MLNEVSDPEFPRGSEAFCIAMGGAFLMLGLMLKPEDLFDLAQTDHHVLFQDCEHAWEPLKSIKDYILTYPNPLGFRIAPAHGEAWIGDQVLIGEGTIVEPGAMIKGPAIIGRRCQIRHSAYIRDNVIIGDDCVVGNSCELKNSLLFNRCQIPHFNYVGDSILGFKAHLGAGVKISNFKLVPGNVRIHWNGEWVDTGLRKFGALVGDNTDVGCNTVLNPGSILGRQSVVYPNINWRGILPAASVAKNRAAIEIVARQSPKSAA